ncbi:MAG: MATE family efflux transporter [Oscillospiraceae bacterium]|nr:MATE family efflux transporter [Oscillospiraceae bacterium]
MKQKANILGEAPIGKLIIKFAVPCILSFLLTSIYNIVDQIFIGHGLGYLGNGATNVVYPVTVIALAVSLLIGNGCSAFFSVTQGRGDEETVRRSVANTISAIIVSSIILTAVFLIFMEPILKAFGATTANIGYAREYYKFLMIGTPFNMFTICLGNIVRVDGSPRFNLCIVFVGCVVNIILDAVAIFILHWGMMGAAVATVIGQITTTAMTVWYLFNTKTFKLTKESFRPDFKLIGKIASLGSSGFFSQISLVLVMFAMNNVMVHYGALSRFGEDIPLAVVGVVSKVFSIITAIALGLGVGAQPVTGFNYGAGKLDRVQEAYRKLMLIEIVIGIVATVLVEAFPIKIISIFGSGNDLYNEFAVMTIRIHLSTMILYCIHKGCSLFMQGLGKSFLSMLMTFIREILLHIPFIFILPALFGIEAALFSMPIADLGGFILTIIMTKAVISKIKPKS